MFRSVPGGYAPGAFDMKPPDRPGALQPGAVAGPWLNRVTGGRDGGFGEDLRDDLDLEG